MEMFEGDGIDPLTVSLYQMDLDRTQFLLRSYLRVRLQKVATYYNVLLVCVWMGEVESATKYPIPTAS